jgi:acyl-CoA thioesterase
MSRHVPTVDPSTTMTPQERAEYVRDAMWEHDWASQALGMKVQAIGPGHCTISMTVRRDMLNGHQTCHGGMMTALADSSFAFACNSYNELTVAAGFMVDILAPAYEGDVLTATGTEVDKGGRLGLYDVEVRNQDGKRIALFRGSSYTARGKPAVPHERLMFGGKDPSVSLP